MSGRLRNLSRIKMTCRIDWEAGGKTFFFSTDVDATIDSTDMIFYSREFD
jgi:hypothetical protein